MATLIPSILNAIQIMVFNVIYSTIAYWLTNYENHKTQSSYEKALIMKTYMFQFLNSFSLLFYIAFIKREVTGCIVTIDGNAARSKDLRCTDELALQMRSIMIIAILKNIMEIGLPCLLLCLKRGTKRKLYDVKLHQF